MLYEVITDLSQIRPELVQLYGQLALYGPLAWWGIRRSQRVA